MFDVVDVWYRFIFNSQLTQTHITADGLFVIC